MSGTTAFSTGDLGTDPAELINAPDLQSVGPRPPHRQLIASPEETSALVALYNATGGREWNSKLNWADDSNPCMEEGGVVPWYGLDCESNYYTPHIKGVMLSDNRVQGQLPTQIGHLTYLTQRFDLSGNSLRGTVPTEIGRWGDLTEWLDLSGNELSSTLPTELGCLSRFEHQFSFRSNRLTGPIPTELGGLTNFKSYLDLTGNKFTGTIPTEMNFLLSMDHVVISDVSENATNSSAIETYAPSSAPTSSPTSHPTPVPVGPAPTQVPVPVPSSAPTSSPTSRPTPVPVGPVPTQVPVPVPSSAPTSSPTTRQTRTPSASPSLLPTVSFAPSLLNDSPEPSASPSNAPLPVLGDEYPDLGWQWVLGGVLAVMLSFALFAACKSMGYCGGDSHKDSEGSFGPGYEHASLGRGGSRLSSLSGGSGYGQVNQPRGDTWENFEPSFPPPQPTLSSPEGQRKAGSAPAFRVAFKPKGVKQTGGSGGEVELQESSRGAAVRGTISNPLTELGASSNPGSSSRNSTLPTLPPPPGRHQTPAAAAPAMTYQPPVDLLGLEPVDWGSSPSPSGGNGTAARGASVAQQGNPFDFMEDGAEEVGV